MLSEHSEKAFKTDDVEITNVQIGENWRDSADPPGCVEAPCNTRNTDV